MFYTIIFTVFIALSGIADLISITSLKSFGLPIRTVIIASAIVYPLIAIAWILGGVEWAALALSGVIPYRVAKTLMPMAQLYVMDKIETTF